MILAIDCGTHGHDDVRRGVAGAVASSDVETIAQRLHRPGDEAAGSCVPASIDGAPGAPCVADDVGVSA
jgi:hypothetical protein